MIKPGDYIKTTTPINQVIASLDNDGETLWRLDFSAKRGTVFKVDNVTSHGWPSIMVRDVNTGKPILTFYLSSGQFEMVESKGDA